MCHGKSDFEGKVVIVTKETDYYIKFYENCAKKWFN
jgi:hypothetical protein